MNAFECVICTENEYGIIGEAVVCRNCVDDIIKETERKSRIKELKKELKHYNEEIDILVKGLNKLKYKPAIKSNKFWASALIASEIKRIEKRLKELE